MYKHKTTSKWHNFGTKSGYKLGNKLLIPVAIIRKLLWKCYTKTLAFKVEVAINPSSKIRKQEDEEKKTNRMPKRRKPWKSREKKLKVIRMNLMPAFISLFALPFVVVHTHETFFIDIELVLFGFRYSFCCLSGKQNVERKKERKVGESNDCMKKTFSCCWLIVNEMSYWQYQSIILHSFSL